MNKETIKSAEKIKITKEMVAKKAKNQVKHKVKERIITQFIKKSIRGRSQKVGVLVGCLDDYKVIQIGWSKVNITKGDIFDKKRGLMIALERTKANKELSIPQSLDYDINRFKQRCKRYFKDGFAYEKRGLFAKGLTCTGTVCSGSSSTLSPTQPK